MAATADSFRTVFWLAAIPAAVSVVVLVVFVREPAAAETRRAAARPRIRELLGTLGARFWWLVLVAALFTLARFSEAFLILKAAEGGLRFAYVPAVLVVMNVAYALSAYPAGWLSDRMNRWGVLAIGAALLVVADIALAFGASLPAIGLGIVLWGLHMGFTQGLLAALVADSARAEQRGTAFGVFNLVTGLALLAASVLAGVLWDRGGPELTFLAGAALTVVAGGVAFALYALKKIDGRGSTAA
jgi:predicted MFS family arabinose efflux permease